MLKSFVILILSCTAAQASLPENFVHAEITVESDGRSNLVGDNGAAIGCLQIHKACWIDSKISGSYSNCFNRAYSIKVMEAYLNRYCPAAVKSNDFEVMARCWNSGPNWKNKIKLTNNYWHKIKNQLKN